MPETTNPGATTETTTPETPAAPAPETPAVELVEANIDIVQTVGGQKFKINPSTTARQVKTANGVDVETRVNTLERAMAGTATMRIVDDIAGRDALKSKGLIPGDQVWVIDASADETVESGGAKYLYMLDGAWLKVAEAESMDVVCEWNHIQGKPESTPQAIDLAVASKHTHDNIETISHLSDDGTGRLMYKGKAINDGLIWSCRCAGKEDIPANLADGGFAFIDSPTTAAGGADTGGAEIGAETPGA